MKMQKCPDVPVVQKSYTGLELHTAGPFLQSAFEKLADYPLLLIIKSNQIIKSENFNGELKSYYYCPANL